MMCWMRHGWIGLTATVFLLAAGCGGEESPQAESPQATATRSPAPKEPAHLRVIATDFDFALPSSVPAGPYDFTLINRGEQFHQAQIYRLNDGVTYQEFQEALLSDLESFPSDMISPPTGVGAAVSAGQRGTAKGALEPGVYAVACALPDLEGGAGSGKPHYALGMLSELQVR